LDRSSENFTIRRGQFTIPVRNVRFAYSPRDGAKNAGQPFQEDTRELTVPAPETTERLIDGFRKSQALARLVGEAPAFVRAIAQIPRAARSDASVLISGETGTGKELVARAIHYHDTRAAFPFVPVNCGALPDTLLEDELFGHERGAFTDAQSRRPGLIAQAEGGSLLLDEVDALSPRAQVALLRVLQDRTYRALGSSRELEARVRFIAATNACLSSLVKAGGFRADLYYRLCVYTIHLPPLRERTDDILTLAEHFLRRYARPDRPPPELSPGARAALLSFDWPGNVRELESTMIRCAEASELTLIGASDLGLPLLGDGHAPEPRLLGSFRTLKRQTVEAFERHYLIRLLTDHRGNVSHAARAAGKDRRDLGRLLKKYRLDPTHFATTTSARSDAGR
jgi:DNA-binding NtrC family response regulator